MQKELHLVGYESFITFFLASTKQFSEIVLFLQIKNKNEAFGFYNIFISVTATPLLHEENNDSGSEVSSTLCHKFKI